LLHRRTRHRARRSRHREFGFPRPEGAFSQTVLFRGVDLAIVWPLLAAIAVIGTVYFAFALGRFRRVIFGT